MTRFLGVGSGTVWGGGCPCGRFLCPRARAAAGWGWRGCHQEEEEEEEEEAAAAVQVPVPVPAASFSDPCGPDDEGPVPFPPPI